MHTTTTTINRNSDIGRFAVAAVSLAAALACGGASAQAAAVNAGEPAFAPGRILVMPRAGLADAALAKILGELGGGKGRRVGKSELRIVDVQRGQEKQMVDKIARHPHFKFAELDQQVSAAFAPNDPYMGSEWHAIKTNAPAAWDLAKGTGVTIAIIDTGVESTHQDLINQLVPGYNFYDNNTTTGPVNGHGTWVAGAAAATINNGIGVAGMAGSAKIMPLRVVDGSGVGYWSAIASAITYAADKGARVANASFENLLSSSSIMSAASYMKSKNGLVVIAAGNCGCNPGLISNSAVIPVSATDSNDALATFSSYGTYVAISAPGTAVYTTGLGGSYTQGTGTSFSSPVVAGTIALMMSAKPSMPNTEIEKLLYSTAVDLGAVGRDNYFGVGRVDAGAAVKAVMASTTTTDTQAPSAAISAPLASSTVGGLVPVNVSAADNVGVSRVELRVNGALIATDTTSPYAFSWDSKGVANGSATLVATAYDAAGNSASSGPVSVMVSNIAVTDTTPPSVSITSATASTIKPRGSVTITTSASDNSGTVGLTQSLYIDNVLMTRVSGGTLSYSWTVNKVAYGPHIIKVVAQDAAGNQAYVTTTLTK